MGLFSGWLTLRIMMTIVALSGPRVVRAILKLVVLSNGIRRYSMNLGGHVVLVKPWNSLASRCLEGAMEAAMGQQPRIVSRGRPLFSPHSLHSAE